MEILISLLFGIMIGSAVAYRIAWKTRREYEKQLQILREDHQQALKKARDRSIDGSRAVIKGKIAEQFAPILPGFQYLPSDARFIGDPIDYIVFNGYTDVKDNGGNDLEIVILDIKTGQATLSRTQQAIEKAIHEGRIRFEVIRPDIQSEPTSRPALPYQKSHFRAYAAWTRAEDEQLIRRYREGASITDLVHEFQRKPGGVRSRLKRLGLLR
jgi:predicted Holliday junction resolvase-like endonuclease